MVVMNKDLQVHE
jgi:hypothetical protein